MRVVCEHCAQVLAIPDEKVPDRAFSITCPKCRKPFRVDPTEATHPRGDTGGGAPEPAAAESADRRAPTAPTSSLSPGTPPPPAWDATRGIPTFTPLLPLRPTEQGYLDALPSVGFVAQSTPPSLPGLPEALRHLGLGRIVEHDTVEAATAAMAESRPAVMLIREASKQRAAATLGPIRELPPRTRRKIIVAVVCDDIRSLDGGAAFELEVNATLASGDLPDLPQLLRRAILHHQERYRNWIDQGVG